MSNLTAALTSPFNIIRGVLNRFFIYIGELSFLVVRSIVYIFRGNIDVRDSLSQMAVIGFNSIPIAVLTTFSSGSVIALYVAPEFIKYGAEGLTGAMVAFIIGRELVPVLVGVVVAARAGSAIAAEIGTMKVSEQIDAIEASAVDPKKLLAATRIAACIVVLPLLTLAASFFGVLMGWVAATLIEPISLTRFLSEGFKGAGFKDFLPPTFKTCVYGLIIGTVACFQGMRAKGGAEGVGSAATTSVVLSSLFVILADVILVKVILLLFP